MPTEKEESSPLYISSRGRRALKPPLPYLGSFFQALQDPCHPSNNPHGRIALCVAENKLVLPALSKRLNQLSTSSVFEEFDNYCYNDMRGILSARESVARFLSRNFYKSDGIDANNVILGSGCAGLLNAIFLSLCEEQEAVLIPAPYYAAFESDMKVLAKLVPFPVHMQNPETGPTDIDLDIAFEKCKEQGLNVKMLLLTNPNNPLGTVYAPEVIQNCIKWARSKGDIHTVVDEIYALSIHEPVDSKFKSVLEILDNELSHDVHFLWALSKDFGSSGFRIGVLYTQNQGLNDALSNLNIFSSVSHPMQAIIRDLFNDDTFIDEFLNHSRELLVASKRIVMDALDEVNISYVYPTAGIFLYADFSSLLPMDSFEGEAQLATLFQDAARIVMTPSESQRDTQPGKFRICYAWVTPEVLTIAMQRLKRCIHDIRHKKWHELSQDYYS